jgi:hypothetical protein
LPGRAAASRRYDIRSFIYIRSGGEQCIYNTDVASSDGEEESRLFPG